MAGNAGNGLLRAMAAVYQSGATGDLTDGQLLERFLTRRDDAAEQAFTALVERHGAMVHGVCHSVLSHPQDAQDAFQATFLVLVLKARRLWVRDSLGPWLHQVALRTARASRVRDQRRRRHEKMAAEQRLDTTEPRPVDDLAGLLHAELARLPERFRVPLVVCDLEGQSLEQAARHLGIPVGTIKSRLARGRVRLRDRLRRLGHDPVPAHGSVPIPPALVLATVRQASRLVTAGTTVLTPGIRLLVLGGIQAMSLSRWSQLVAAAAVFLTTLTGAGLLAVGQSEATRKTDTRPDLKDDPGDAVVESGPFRWIITERGVLESAEPNMVPSPLPGRTRILSILPEGTKVTKGQVVAVLDDASLREGEKIEETALRTAKTELDRAEQARRLVELSVAEYERGIDPARRHALSAEVKLAEQRQSQAAERAKRARDTVERLDGLIGALKSRTPENLLAELTLRDHADDAALELSRARVGLERVQNERKLFEDFTHPKTLATLQAELANARRIESDKQGPVALAGSRLAKTKRLIEQAELVAPCDGFVVHASNRAVPNGFEIRENALVQERQNIFSVPNLSKIVMNAKVRESIVDRVQVGQKGTVQVDAFPGRTLQGRVLSIAPLPDPYGMYVGAVKVYTTRIELEDGLPGLRPGMTAVTDLVLAEVPEALKVPLSAVLTLDGLSRVGLRQADGSFHLHGVTIGLADDKTATVTGGLKAGDRVHLDPVRLLSPAERERYESKGRGTTAASKGIARKGAANKAALFDEGIMRLLSSLSPEQRSQLTDGTQEQRARILKQQGASEAQIERYERQRAAIEKARGANTPAPK